MEIIRKFFKENDLFARHCGIEIVDIQPGRSKVSMKIERHHMNGANTVHGGAIFTLADFAFAIASNSHGTLAMGINTSVAFVKSAKNGSIHAEAREISINPKLATYLVEVTDDNGEMIASFQGTVYRKKDLITATP